MILLVLARTSHCFALGLTMGFLIQGLDILLGKQEQPLKITAVNNLTKHD
jgi:hypothetical protein